jgi:hypothetical protein
MSVALKVAKAIYDRVGFSRRKRICIGDFSDYKTAEQGNELIAKAIRTGNPCLVGRLGYIESNALLNHLETCKYKSISSFERSDAFLGEFRHSWDPNVISLLQTSAGVFPATEKQAEAFSIAYLEAIKSTDLLGYFNDISGENYIRKKFCQQAVPFFFEGLEPYLHRSPWSAELKGKDVLVIHPFEQTIKSQYELRKNIFPDPNVLPDFNLKTLKAVQSMQGNIVGYPSWNDALDSMRDQMSGIQFDVCIVGAGAYGMPLCSHAKKMGKVALYMGGATQILFGIRGKRWEKYKPHISKLFNDAWVRPSEDERPIGYKNMEGACYW